MQYQPRIIIYAICQPETGECLYVGQTRNWGQRRNKHTSINRPFEGMTMVPLGVARGATEASEKERLWLERMREEGENPLNKQTPGRTADPIGMVWKIEELGEFYGSYSDIGNRFGYSGGAVSGSHRKQNGRNEPYFWYNNYLVERVV